jgi:hypothetical protein
MDNNPLYQPFIDAETKFMCDLVSPGFNMDNFEPGQRVSQQDPVKLIEVLKRHRLFPAFYNGWLKSPKINEKSWQTFDSELKQLAGINRVQMIHKSAVLVKIIESLKGKGIPAIALKGPALAKMLYNDVGMKSSIDLDIFIDIKNCDKAISALYESGFYCSPVYNGLNRKQKKYFFNNFNHLELSGSDKLLIELHWSLFSNKYVMDIPFGKFYEQSQTVEIADTEIPVLNSLHHALYLMGHGAWHQWSRLDWLYDLTLLMLHNRDILPALTIEAKRQGLEKITAQSLELSRIYFGANPGVYQEQNIVKNLNLWVVKKAVKAIGGEYERKFRIFPRIAYKYYQMRLKNSFRYRLKLWVRTGTNMKDWETLKLPENMFFVYFLIRPVLYVWRKLPHPRPFRQWSDKFS